MKTQATIQSQVRSAPKLIHAFWLAAALASLVAGTGADAGVTFYTSAGTFNPAVASFTARGTEAWSSGGASSAAVNDPLNPGVLNGPFPSGSSVAVGIRVQSNSLGNTPTNTAPGNNMFYAPAGFVGFSGNVQPSKQLSANRTNDSFDIIFNTIGLSVPRAASLSPMYYRIDSGNNTATLTIRVYNQANQFLGSTTVANVPDCLETGYIGIVTTGSDTLGRVNVWATTRDVPGADNIAVYGATPTAPVFDAVTRTASNFNFRLNGQAGQRYAILSSSNLVNWQYSQTNTLASNSISLAVGLTNNLRFYRAQWVP